MSDGPYRSLKLRKPWRDAAERAHKASFSLEECAEAMSAALYDDLKEDVGNDALKTISNIVLDSDQPGLFAQHRDFELDMLAADLPPSSFKQALTEHLQLALHNGLSGEEALVRCLNEAAYEQLAAHSRSIEEHYHRENLSIEGIEKGRSVRSKLEATMHTEKIKNFGVDVVKKMRGEAAPPRIQKKSSIDDGPEV